MIPFRILHCALAFTAAGGLALLTLGCPHKRYGPTRVVAPEAFEKGGVRSMAFVGGDTLYPDIQNRILDALAVRFAAVAKSGSVYRREAVLVQLGGVRLPAPDLHKVRAEAAAWGDADLALAKQMHEKVGAAAFFVVWVVEWSGEPLRPQGPVKGAPAQEDVVDVRKEVVAALFEAGTGRELWHTWWTQSADKVRVRVLPEAEYRKALDMEVQEVIEDLWVRFWIG